MYQVCLVNLVEYINHIKYFGYIEHLRYIRYNRYIRYIRNIRYIMHFMYFRYKILSLAMIFCGYNNIGKSVKYFKGVPDPYRQPSKLLLSLR